ncbi:hypothetical protein Tco_0986021 [Tanacetum coccineum]
MVLNGGGGLVTSLINLVKDVSGGMMYEYLAILAIIACHREWKVAIAQVGPIPVLVEVVGLDHQVEFGFQEVTTKEINAVETYCDLDNSTSNVLIPLDSWTRGLLVYKLPLSVEYGVSTSIGYGVSSSLSNTAYSFKLINTAYPLPLDMAYRSSDIIRMTKVIKGEFEKIKDVKVEDVSLTCDTQLEIFNMEVSRLSGMDNDLFTYEVEVANISCNSKMDDDSEDDDDDDMGYDPSDVAFTEWLGSKNFNYKIMDHYTMKALWIYWIRGDDEVELTDEEPSDDMDEVAKVFRIDTNLFNFKTPICKAFNESNYLLQIDPDLLTKEIEGFKTYKNYKNDWIYEWNKDVPWVDEKPWTNTRVWTKL